MKHILFALALISSLSFSSSYASADGEAGRIYGRLSLGAGGAFTKLNTDADETTLLGPGVSGSFAIGAFLTERLALNADLFGVFAPAPTYIDGDAASPRWTGAKALGGGFTYYLPNDVFIAFSAGVSAGDIGGDPGLPLSFGVGSNFMVGKDWDVGNMGLGVAGQLMGFVQFPEDVIVGTGFLGVSMTASWR